VFYPVYPSPRSKPWKQTGTTNDRLQDFSFDVYRCSSNESSWKPSRGCRIKQYTGDVVGFNVMSCDRRGRNIAMRKAKKRDVKPSEKSSDVIDLRAAR
jgi:hypothetical protein